MKRTHFYLLLTLVFGLVASVMLFNYNQATDNYINNLQQATASQVAGATTVNSLSRVIIDNGDEQLSYNQSLANDEKTTALELLNMIAEENNLTLETKEYSLMGTIIEGIGGKINGQDNKYWMFYVNGEMPMVGADQYQVGAGDILEFKFEASNF